MKLDNLYIVESPLQALVALELSLKHSDQTNGVIYRTAGAGRERNDQQIIAVLRLGKWDYLSPISFHDKKGLSFHLEVRRVVSNIRALFEGQVQSLFFGEFRSQWMHFVRAVVGAKNDVLMDDGAATVTMKREYLDKNIYYPAQRFFSENWTKNIAKKLIYQNMVSKINLTKPVSLASAFVSGDSCIHIDYSNVRKLFQSAYTRLDQPSVYFFGSKYSEASIITPEYEFEFIRRVKSFYSGEGVTFVYCAHRDESEEKLARFKNELDVDVLRPDLPAELFLLERHSDVLEVSAAYSSVLNNISLVLPEKVVRSFKFKQDEIAEKHRDNIKAIYRFYDSKGIKVEDNF